MEGLLPDLTHLIFSYLSIPDRLNCALVSRSWLKCARHPASWERHARLFAHHWGLNVAIAEWRQRAKLWLFISSIYNTWKNNTPSNGIVVFHMLVEKYPYCGPAIITYVLARALNVKDFDICNWKVVTIDNSVYYASPIKICDSRVIKVTLTRKALQLDINNYPLTEQPCCWLDLQNTIFN
jgi:hypothetical protein